MAAFDQDRPERRRRRGLSALLGAAVLCASPAGAALKPIDPRVPTWQQSHLQEGDSAVMALYILAVCARNHRKDSVEALLRSKPNSAEETEAIEALLPKGPDSCLMRTSKLRIHNRTVLRGAVAEAVYNGISMKPLTGDPLPAAADEAVAAGDRIGAGRLVARCAVRRAPLLAHAVVRFNPGSSGELGALRNLTPVLADCLPAGAILGVSRLSIRALLAEELYQAARAYPGSFVHA